MEERKLQVVGSRSYSVSLPKTWILANKLGNHDKIFIEETENNELILSKGVKDKLQKSIVIEVDDDSVVKNKLVFCYMKNIDSVKFHARPLSAAAIKIIRTILRFLEGYEIINESENEIEIRFVFNDITMTVPNILHRMLYLIKQQALALTRKDHESITEYEAAVDRLYYLSVRILFGCVRNYSLRAENKIKNEEDIFFVNSEVKRMEAISDQFLKLIGVDVSAKDLKQINLMINLLTQVIASNEKSSKIKSEFESLKIRSNDPNVDPKLQKIHDFCQDVLEARMNIEFNDTIYS